MSIKGALLKAIFARQRGTTIVSMAPTGLVDSVALDVTTSQQVTWPGQVIDNPLEGEGSYSHAIYRGPVECTIEGILTDSPVEFIAGLVPDATAAQKLRKLVKMYELEEPCSVGMKLSSLLDMGLYDVTAQRTAELGDGIQVTLSFRRVIIVSTAFVPAQFDLDAQIAGAGGVTDLGTQAPIDPRQYTGPTAVGAPG